MKRLLGIWGSIAACFLTAASMSAHAAPDRKPAGKSDTEPLPAIALDRLEINSGAAFGDWAIWRHNEGGDAYFLIHQKTGLAVYLYWGSNGWVNYRTGDGVWYVFFPTGTPSLQNRQELKIERFLGKQPQRRVAAGKYTVNSWTITVSDDAIELFTPNVKSTMSLRARSGEFTHNGRTIGGR